MSEASARSAHWPGSFKLLRKGEPLSVSVTLLTFLAFYVLDHRFFPTDSTFTYVDLVALVYIYGLSTWLFEHGELARVKTRTWVIVFGALGLTPAIVALVGVIVSARDLPGAMAFLGSSSIISAVTYTIVLLYLLQQVHGLYRRVVEQQEKRK